MHILHILNFKKLALRWLDPAYFGENLYFYTFVFFVAGVNGDGRYGNGAQNNTSHDFSKTIFGTIDTSPVYVREGGEWGEGGGGGRRRESLGSCSYSKLELSRQVILVFNLFFDS